MQSYTSTRDEDQNELSYAEVILQGLAPDGGLYVPSRVPYLHIEEIIDLPVDYAELSAFVQSKFIDTQSIPKTELYSMLKQAYGPDNFLRDPASPNEVTPIRQVDDELFIQELSLGPTAAFKDMALQSLGRQLEYVLESQDKKLRIVGATSGDTGSAAEAPFVNSKRASVFMLSPARGMSQFQHAQMGMLSSKTIHNLSVGGNFDDCQSLVKELKRTPGFEDIGALNSINWGRIVSQIPYYFSGYLQVAGDSWEEIDVVVPSGNFGNILAGHYARRMGVPIKNLIVATNENNVLHTLVQTGAYQFKPSKQTTSPSMDISASSNLERLVFEVFEEDAQASANFMHQFSDTGRAVMPSRDTLKNMDFDSGQSTAEDRLKSIKWVYKQSEQQRVIDPHTADGVSVARRYIDQGKNEGRPVVVLSTALPVKFEDTIDQALGFIPERSKRFEGIEEQVPDGAFELISNDIAQLAEFVAKNS